MEYDIIGDVHGHSDKLIDLLEHMGYRNEGGSFRHPNRMAIFVGDLIDRGPNQLDTVMIVRRMIDSGRALSVMGNHELNAIAWHTEDPEAPGRYLRQRNERNRHQHGKFLAEVESNKGLHKELVDWFLTLPVWIELPELRVIQACWHEGYQSEIKPFLTKDNQLTRDLVVKSSRKGSMEYRAIEGLTKGLESRLPDGLIYKSPDGAIRKNVRIRWWKSDSNTLHDLAFMEGKEEGLHIPVIDDARIPQAFDKPTFFGHYWMSGEAKIQTKNVVCVDYSAGRSGDLMAYRWSGEEVLSSKNFCSTRINSDINSYIQRPKNMATS